MNIEPIGSHLLLVPFEPSTATMGAPGKTPPPPGFSLDPPQVGWGRVLACGSGVVLVKCGDVIAYRMAGATHCSTLGTAVLLPERAVLAIDVDRRSKQAPAPSEVVGQVKCRTCGTENDIFSGQLRQHPLRMRCRRCETAQTVESIISNEEEQ